MYAYINKLTGAALLSLLMASGCKKSGGDNAPDPHPNLTIEDLTLFEGNGGTTTFNIQVTLDREAKNPVTLKYVTTDGTAKAGEDYTALNGTLQFAAGERSKTIPLIVVADDIKEGDDVLTLTLSDPTNVVLTRAQATVTIRNDDTKVPFNNNGYDAPTSYAGYTLAWSNEFNNGALDATAWSHQNGDGCPSMCGWGNNELEYYTDRPQNLFFQDGKLIIEANKEQFGARGYTSSKIITSGKKMFKFGRIDIRAKLPKGKGIWPAFWMMPQASVYGGWPTSGEIDIMEMVGHEPNRTHGTIHYGPGPGSTQISRSTALSSGTLADEFHVYSLEWKQDQIKWYLDGNLFSTVNKADLNGVLYPFNEEFFMIFNLAVGGNWPGSPDATTYFPQWLIVDYVRYYQGV
ncbi:family 16 glycosylhydrolase [Nostoc ellipsosporum NOK]|nr:family 16 glycosylhydrolase [Nostoc ellipsosporum NOK]